MTWEEKVGDAGWEGKRWRHREVAAGEGKEEVLQWGRMDRLDRRYVCMSGKRWQSNVKRQWGRENRNNQWSRRRLKRRRRRRTWLKEREGANWSAVLISVQNVLCCRFVSKCHPLCSSKRTCSHKSRTGGHTFAQNSHGNIEWEKLLVHTALKSQLFDCQCFFLMLLWSFSFCPHSDFFYLISPIVWRDTEELLIQTRDTDIRKFKKEKNVIDECQNRWQHKRQRQKSERGTVQCFCSQLIALLSAAAWENVTQVCSCCLPPSEEDKTGWQFLNQKA